MGEMSKLGWLKFKQDDILDKDKMMDNVQECNNDTNLPSSQTFRSYLLLAFVFSPILLL
jgi:hypothetical protein